jgi:ATP-binding cassette subfamily D (ALD) long-chain fatty acid import protein
LIENAEEVALYSGNKVEQQNLDTAYTSLETQLNKTNSSKIGHSMLEDFIIKYLWSAAGYILCSFPVFFNVAADVTKKGIDVQEAVGNRTQEFVTNRRLLVQCSDALGRIMYCF